MNLRSATLLALAAFSLTISTDAADAPSKAGPTGGRLITKVTPHAEVLLNKEQRIEIRFVNEVNRVLPPGEQVVTVIMGDRSAPTTLNFTREGDKLVSDKKVPEGNNHPMVVQIREKQGAKAVLANFNLNLSKCSTCAHPEYACICDHD
jgi:hypothetical protein